MSERRVHYVIVQGGLYWRENSMGYTKNVAEAGIYTETEAMRIERMRRDPPDRGSTS